MAKFAAQLPRASGYISSPLLLFLTFPALLFSLVFFYHRAARSVDPAGPGGAPIAPPAPSAAPARTTPETSATSNVFVPARKKGATDTHKAERAKKKATAAATQTRPIAPSPTSAALRTAGTQSATPALTSAVASPILLDHSGIAHVDVPMPDRPTASPPRPEASPAQA